MAMRVTPLASSRGLTGLTGTLPFALCAVFAADRTLGMEVPRRTVVVDQGSAAADDANPGTPDAPLRTIVAGCRRLRGGDTLLVRKGVYRESLGRIPNGPGYARMTTVSGWPGETVVVKGSDVVGGWVPHAGAIWKLERFEPNTQQVFVEGEPLRQIGGVIFGGFPLKKNHPLARLHPGQGIWPGRTGNGIADMGPGTFFYDHKAKVLYVWLEDGGDPNLSTIEVSTRRYWLAARDMRFVNIADLTFEHSMTSGVSRGGAVNIVGSHVIFDNVTFRRGDSTGCNLVGSNFLLHRCAFIECGDKGMSARGWGHRIIDCVATRNNTRGFNESWGSAGIKIVGGGGVKSTVVAGLVSTYNRGPGLWFDWQNGQNTVRDCVLAFNTRHGLFYEASESCLIANNIIYGNAWRGIYLQNSSYCEVVHNLVVMNGMPGIVAADTRRRAGGAFNEDYEGVFGARGNRIIGNILVENSGPPVGTAPWAGRPELVLPQPLDGNHSNYNVFYRAERATPFWSGWPVPGFEGKAWKDLKSWADETGNDTRSVVADPGIVGFDRIREMIRSQQLVTEWRLAADSPARGLSKPLASIADDINGRVRGDARGRWTAGPWE